MVLCLALRKTLAFTKVSAVKPVNVKITDTYMEYDIGQAHVKISFEAPPKYYITEPTLSDAGRKLFQQVLEELYLSLTYEEAKDPEKIMTHAERIAAVLKGLDVFRREKDAFRYLLLREIHGYGVLDVLFRDPYVEEISIEGPNIPVAIIHKEVPGARWIDTNIVFRDDDEINSYLTWVSQKVGVVPSTAFPILEFSSPEGHRIIVFYGREVTGRGPGMTVRKFPEEPFTAPKLLAFSTLSPLMMAYLWLFVENKAFVFVIGEMASGKTTTLQSLLTLIPMDAKIVTIEDTPELRLPHTHWQPLYTRTSFAVAESSTRTEIGLMELLKASLRTRADYVIVGESRGAEVQYLVQAAAMGQGSMSTFHAGSAHEALVRLRSPPLNVQESFLALIWAIVLMRRVLSPQGKWVRRVVRTWEIVSSERGVEPMEMFTWDPNTDTFLPDDPEEVIRRSFRLKMLAEIRGWSEDDLYWELKKRMDFLQKLLEEGVTSFEIASKRIMEFYRERMIRKK
uniref:Bacterial type II secretion system protein E domain-containing protein n=1 Tax=Staphylothermus marinus TaxID=2280 RepID=A0A7C4H6S1_STAMA